MTLVTDSESRELAAAVGAELDGLGCEYHSYLLEEFGERPLVEVPQEIADQVGRSQVSIWIVARAKEEDSLYRQLARIVKERGVRHAQLSNIDRKTMLEGMRADYFLIDKLADRLIGMLSRERVILRAKNGAGTDIVAECDPKGWRKATGIFTGPGFATLPAGEVWAVPERVNGTYAADACVGGPMAARFGDIRYTPLIVQVQHGRIADVSCESRGVRDAFMEILESYSTFQQVGKVGLGVNPAMRDPIGAILQDNKIPGLHIGFGRADAQPGDPDYLAFPLDLVGRFDDVWIGDTQIIHNGGYLILPEA